MIKSPFKVEKSFLRIKEMKLTIWVVDGSCCHQDGQVHAGYAALQPNSGKVLQGTVRPYSAQAAEIVAVVAVLYEEKQEEDVCICSDSDWVIRALSDWMPVWIQNQMHSSDGKPIKYSTIFNTPGI
ncbi:uncharacterized protein LOC115271521 [Terrapene carolina triunguis]|uniref:uncharacterized protein LOC115271521 n=1 Tax=Terrapene triunguis TaxID=2587831 RepID=UPI0011566AC3|nr:uncharacterized protein LOC115271521 [Terrapene carolina triunguis]